MTDAFPLIEIAGAPLERGRSYGSQAKALIERAAATYSATFASVGLGWEQVVEAGDTFAARIEKFSQAQHEELVGIAEGAGRRIGEIVALNARTELLYGIRGAPRDPGLPDATHRLGGEGCTGAVVLPEASAGGRVLHGQNWDWRAEAADITMLLRIRPDGGPTILTMVEAGTLARCGLNSAGIAITGNFLKTDRDFAAEGIPAPFVRRKVLMAKNFHDAMAAVITTERSFSINVMISDAGGAAIDFETTPEHLFWVRPERGLLVHANHFVAPEARLRVVDRGLRVTPDSLYRDLRVRSLLESHHGRIAIEHLEAAFADDFGAPYAVCREPAQGPGGESAATVATVLMDVAAGELRVAPTPYRDRQYTRYEL